jgi:uncharacterized protein YndB with AHSA1/START domain
MTSMTPRKATLTLPADEQILITRDFDAPVHLVWKAYTTPELVRRWWHAGRGGMHTCEIDLRVGGRYRFAMNAREGGYEVAFHGEFREIVENARLVSTEVYEGAPGAPPVLNTLTFTEVDGRTHLELLMEADSRETRDMIIATGMEDGLQDALDLLEEVARAEA